MRPVFPPIGLCETCHFKREVLTARGSVFIFCKKSYEKLGFRKYPTLPVGECAGYLEGAEGSTGNETRDKESDATEES